MDKKVLVKNLNHLFCNLNKEGKKYLEVWLSDIDFGGLYRSGKYNLNVKADHTIDSCKDEIREILAILDQKAHDELQYIWSVAVYDSKDQVHCISQDLLVYDEESSCR
jgi:hypothetical protein